MVYDDDFCRDVNSGGGTEEEKELRNDNQSFFSNLFYWNTVYLQCCINLCCTAKWFRHIFTQIYTYILFHLLFHYNLSQDIEYSSLCYTAGPCCLSILYIIIEKWQVILKGWGGMDVKLLTVSKKPRRGFVALLQQSNTHARLVRKHLGL